MLAVSRKITGAAGRILSLRSQSLSISRMSKQNRSAAELLEALEAHSGLVCLVGAGGKKTTLYRLAATHPGRVGVTATVHIPHFPKTLNAYKVVAEKSALLTKVVEAANQNRVVAFAQPSEKRARHAGVEPLLISQIHAAASFDVTLIKADGARSRLLKAPDENEPQVPLVTHTVIPVVSAHAIGRPLTEDIVHRVDRVATITGASEGETITPAHLGKLLASDDGALKGVGDAKVIPLIAMVDNEKLHVLARQAAEHALMLSRRFEHVVLAAMKKTEPLVEVVVR